MEYKGFKITTSVAGMEGYAASIVDPKGIFCGKVCSREGEAGAVEAARKFIDKKLG
jgi:hypothetical protein